MPTLYLTEQGSVLRAEQGRLVVEKEGRVLFSAPVLQVERVLLFGTVQITPHAIQALLTQGIETSFLSSQGRLKGRLVGLEARNLPLRLAQYDRARDTAFALRLARAIVLGKLRNARTVLGHHARNHDAAAFAPLLERLEELCRSVPRKTALNSLLGVEGAGAALYFEGLRQMLRVPDLEFPRRSRRPPRDPVNALLSFGYSLVGNELMGVVTALGLDPYLGFLHGISYGRPSLPLDLLEEFRAPLVDRLALSLLNLRILQADDFTATPDGGQRLLPAALKRYLGEYEKRVSQPFQHPETGQQTSFRRLFALQAQAMARAIKGEAEYVPYAHHW